MGKPLSLIVCMCVYVCVWIYNHKKQSFSYDIIIDVYLKPWLIEVQITSLSEFAIIISCNIHT